MIGKIVMGKSFRGCLQYCLNDKQTMEGQQIVKDRAEVIGYNQCFGNLKELISQFNDVRALNLKLAKPVMHITLSLARGDKLSSERLKSMVDSCAKNLGFESNQWIAVRHKDTAHSHVHIVVNRIGFDGKTVKDSNNFKKIAEFCRKAEFVYGLQKVQSPNKFLAKEKRTGQRLDSRKEKLKADIKTCLHQGTNLEVFTRAMKEKGYQVIKSRGIAFRDGQKVYTKGSDVGYSLARIEKILTTEISERPSMLQPQFSDRITQRNAQQYEWDQKRDIHTTFHQMESQSQPGPAPQEYDNSLKLFRPKKRKRKGRRI